MIVCLHIIHDNIFSKVDYFSQRTLGPKDLKYISGSSGKVCLPALQRYKQMSNITGSKATIQTVD